MELKYITLMCATAQKFTERKKKMKAKVLSIIMAVLVLTALFAVSVFADETAVDLSSNRLFKSYPAIRAEAGKDLGTSAGHTIRGTYTETGAKDILYVSDTETAEVMQYGVRLGYHVNLAYGTSAFKSKDGRAQVYTYAVSEEKTINIEEFPYVVVAVSIDPSSWLNSSTYQNFLADKLTEEEMAKFATPQMRVVIKLYDDDNPYEWFCDYNNYSTALVSNGDWVNQKQTGVIDVLEKYPEISGTVEYISIYPTWSNIPCEYSIANGDDWADIQAYYKAADKSALTAPEHVWANLKNSAGEVKTIDMKDYFDATVTATYPERKYFSGCYLGGFAFVPVEAAANSCATAMTTSGGLRSIDEDSYYTVTKTDPNSLEDYFTLAVIPNISNISSDEDALTGIANWIVDNKDAENIKYTIQLGNVFTPTWSVGHFYYKDAATYNSLLPQGEGKRPFTHANTSTATAYFGYYAALGRIQKSDGTYEESISKPIANLRAAMDILTANGIPYVINPTAQDHGNQHARDWSYLNSKFARGDFGRDGAYSGTIDSSLYAANFTGMYAAGYFDDKPAGTALSPMATVIVNGYLQKEDLLASVTTISNVYYTFEANGEKYIVINLESYPRARVTSGQTPIDWANDLLAQYSDHKAIVVTERFAAADGSLDICWNVDNAAGSSGSYWQWASLSDKATTFTGAPNWLNYGRISYGDEIWRTVLQKHDNLIMVVCSNFSNSAPTNTEMVYSTLTGVNGNTVQVVRADMSSVITGDTNGLVLLRFAPDGAIDTTFVSPSDSFYSYHNVFDATAEYTITGCGVDTTAVGGEAVTITPTVAEGENAVAVVLEYTLDTTYYEGETVYTEDHTPTYEKVVSGNGSFTFNMPYANVTVKEVITVAEDEVKIALSSTSMRIEGTPGMRFLATVYEGSNVPENGYEYGILMIPRKVLEGLGLTEDNFVLEEGADGWECAYGYGLDIKMESRYSYSTDRFSYTGVLTGIPDTEYGTDILVRAYVKTGEGTYEYSNILERSASEIANMAFFSGKEPKANETALKAYMVAETTAE